MVVRQSVTVTLQLLRCQYRAAQSGRQDGNRTFPCWHSVDAVALSPLVIKTCSDDKAQFRFCFAYSKASLTGVIFEIIPVRPLFTIARFRPALDAIGGSHPLLFLSDVGDRRRSVGLLVKPPHIEGRTSKED